MSDDDSSNGTEQEEEEVMYQCKKCPGKYFTAAEKDLHRQTHRQQRTSTADPDTVRRKPGPKSASRKREQRASSPAVTLFDPIPSSQSQHSSDQVTDTSPKRNKPRGRRREEGDDDDDPDDNEDDDRPKKKKITSRKKLSKDDVASTKYPGG